MLQDTFDVGKELIHLNQFYSITQEQSQMTSRDISNRIQITTTTTSSTRPSRDLLLLLLLLLRILFFLPMTMLLYRIL